MRNDQYVAWAGEQKKDVTERLQMATDVLSQMASAPDKGIPEEVLDSAKCIAVVPNLVKGGFILGGKHGRGVATCRTAEGWSAPAFISVGGGSATRGRRDHGRRVGRPPVDGGRGGLPPRRRLTAGRSAVECRG